MSNQATPRAEPLNLEPVAWRNKNTGSFCTGGFLCKDIDTWIPLYAAPVQPVKQEPCNPDVTFNEDGTFSLTWYDGDEIRIIPPEREWVDITDREAEAAFDRGGNELCLKLRAVIAAFKEKQK